jgi:hypothetical protein
LNQNRQLLFFALWRPKKKGEKQKARMPQYKACFLEKKKTKKPKIL